MSFATVLFYYQKYVPSIRHIYDGLLTQVLKNKPALTRMYSKACLCHTTARDGTAAQTVTLNVDSSGEVAAPAPGLPKEVFGTLRPELSNSGESRNSPGLTSWRNAFWLSTFARPEIRSASRSVFVRFWIA